MESFEFTVKTAVGIHARPAAQLNKEAGKYQSTITVDKDGRRADVKRLMALMGVGIKCGETVTFYFEGTDETVAVQGVKEYCEKNL